MRYKYIGFWGSQGVCELQIFLRQTEKGPKSVAIATELPENKGTSITNMAQRLATEIFHKLNLADPGLFVWIEHYPARGKYTETYALVKFDWNGKMFSNPQWQPLTEAEVKSLIASL